MIISLFVIVILILSFFGGFKQGAVKNFFSLVSMFIAVPLAGLYYDTVARWLSFLPGENWEHFIGFFIVLGVVSAILAIIFLIPGRIIGKLWSGGILFRLLGGTFNVISAAIGMVVFTLVLFTYPVFDFLVNWLANSSVLMSLVNSLTFVQALLPDEFQRAAGAFVAIGSLL